MLKAGQRAPDFSLPDQNGALVSLSGFRGRKVALFFYGKDNAPEDTRKVGAFSKAYQAFEKAGAVVIGISPDPTASHQKFSQQMKLPYYLLSDVGLTAAKAYEVRKSTSGQAAMSISRATYLIDGNGVIKKIFENANPDKNTEEILHLLGVG